MKIRTWLTNRFLVLILGLGVLALPTVAADGFGAEDDEWSSADDKPRKKSKKKAKRGKKSKKEAESDHVSGDSGKQALNKSKKKSKESKAVEAEKVNAAVADRQLWGKIQSIKVKTVNFPGGRVSEYIRFFKEEAAKNGLELTMTYLPADKGDATVLAGATKGAVSELIFPSVMLADVNLAEALELACIKARCQYLVENNEIKIIHDTHYVSRTYSISRMEILDRDGDEFVGMDDLAELFRERGIHIPQRSKVSFENDDKQLVYVGPLHAHKSIAEYEQQLEELRAGLPKSATYFKKYCATLRKIEKTCEKLQGGSTKKIKSKLKPFFKQLEASCPDSMLEQMSYYIHVNPQEKKKMKKLIEDAANAIQQLIDVCYEYDDGEAAELAENLAAHISRLDY